METMMLFEVAFLAGVFFAGMALIIYMLATRDGKKTNHEDADKKMTITMEVGDSVEEYTEKLVKKTLGMTTEWTKKMMGTDD